MISSHDSPRSGRAAIGAAVALQAAGLFLACATVVEDPISKTDVPTSSAGGATFTAASTADTASTAGSNATSAATTGTPNTAGSVTTAAEAATSSSSSASITTGASSASATSSALATSSTISSSTTSSSSTVTDGTGGAAGTTTGSFATTVTDGVGGSTATSASVTNSTTGGLEFCDDPLTPAENVGIEGSTGAFDTTDGVCFKLDFAPADFAGWGCSNFEAGAGNRTITVNGTTVTCGHLPLPEPAGGSYYFDFGPGTNVSAAMYWWNWE